MGGITVDSFPAVAGVIVLLAALALLVSGASLIAYSARTSREEIARRIRLIQPFGTDAISRVAEKLASGESLVRVQSDALGARERREIARRLARFGVPEKRAITVFLALRLSLVLVLGVSVWLLAPNIAVFGASRLLTVLAAGGAAILGWFLPMILVRAFVNQHTAMVVSGFPDALELLVICVEAGLSLEDSLGRIVKELRLTHPQLAAEMALTSADLKILPSRDQAFANLAERVDAPSIRSVVTTLSQTMRYGTPLAQALRVAASEMRNDSLIAMEGRANKLPALLTVPMMLFIMPTIFLIVGGPAALRIIDALLK